jgi:hypothetical protein
MEDQTNNIDNQELVKEVTTPNQENNSSNSNEIIIDNQIINTEEKLGNIPLAITFGLLASVIGAILWAVITVSTGYQIGYMAIAIGFLVGYTVKFAGRGNQITFGVIGAVLSLFGCFLGNYLSQIGFASSAIHMGFFDTLTLFKPSFVFESMKSQFALMDLVFYGIAGYEGFKFSVLN